MGTEILYGATCQAQLRGPDFEAGTAFHQEGIATGERCAPESLKAADKQPGPLALYRSKVRDGGRVAFKDLRLRR